MKDHHCFGQFCSICQDRKEKTTVRLIFLSLVIVWLLFSCFRAYAQTPGYDVLGVAKYCDTFLKAPKLPAFSTLMTTFGNPFDCIERRIQQGGVEKVQIDVRDATCFRNKVCPPGTPPLTDWNFLSSKVQVINRYALRYPQIEWWVSPFLEHDFRDPAVIIKACQVVKKACSSCKCINSPFTGATPAGIPVEKHGTKVRAFAVSGDGASIFDADNIEKDGNSFQHRTSGLNQTYAWWNELNGRCTGEENFVPPLKRTAWPEWWQFHVAHKIMTSVEDPFPKAPAQCKSVRDVTAPEITKPFAEQYCNSQKPDIRGNKPLLIIKVPKQRNLPVLDPSGKVVGCFRHYGPYTSNNLQRWYTGDCSGQNSWELYKSLGQEWGFVLLENGNCIRFNSIRRQGVYR